MEPDVVSPTGISVSLSDSDAQTTFTAPALRANGADITLNFQLRVTGTKSATDTVVITVTAQATVSAVSISSSAGTTHANTYARGETIAATAQFSEVVNVTGTPRLALAIGSATRYAAYASGTGTNTLTFNYTVQAGDSDTDGVSIAANALSLNSGTRSKTPPPPAWPPTWPIRLTVAASASHLVDGSIVPGTPQADAGADRAVKEATTVTLDGTSSSDPNPGQTATLTYAWVVTDAPATGPGSNVRLNAANVSMPTFTAPAIANASDPDIEPGPSSSP